MDTHTHIHTYIHTHRTTTVTLAAHAHRGLITCSCHKAYEQSWEEDGASTGNIPGSGLRHLLGKTKTRKHRPFELCKLIIIMMHLYPGFG